MNKSEVLKKAAFDACLPLKYEQKAVEAFLCAVADMLREEKEVVLPDFGKFTVQEYAATRFRHPKTGEIAERPATKRVRFKPFNGLTDYSMKYGL